MRIILTNIIIFKASFMDGVKSKERSYIVEIILF
jgi:hypothetical protein